MRSPVTVEERVAVTVWKLATNIEYRSLASLFGLGRSTVGKIVLETCNIMATKLLSRYMRFPEGTRLRAMRLWKVLRSAGGFLKWLVQ